MACRGILRPPYGAASSLLEWGIDLWPYVNGRALVSGLRLADMDSRDMLDVLHYFLEDDMNVGSAEQADARDAVRQQIYEEMYNSSYKYGRKTNTTAVVKDFDAEAEEPQEKLPEPFNPAAKPKRYIPPTRFDGESTLPFGSTLDAPLQH